jgi:hypothetical protein
MPRSIAKAISDQAAADAIFTCHLCCGWIGLLPAFPTASPSACCRSWRENRFRRHLDQATKHYRKTRKSLDGFG